jgi:hypothetical protein
MHTAQVANSEGATTVYSGWAAFDENEIDFPLPAWLLATFLKFHYNCCLNCYMLMTHHDGYTEVVNKFHYISL